MKSGLVREIFMMALDSIRMNKLRSSLTILGIVIGVLTIVGMVAVIEGLNASFARQLEAMGSNLLFVSRFEPGIQFGRMPEELRRRRKIAFHDAEAVERSCPSVAAVTSEVTYFRFLPPARVKYMANEIENPEVSGTNHRYLQIYEEYTVDTGRFFTAAENLNKRDVCVIGAEIVDALFPNQSPLNKTIMLEGRKLMVIGTLAKIGKFMGRSRDSKMIIPTGTFRKFFPGEDDVTLIVKLKSGSNSETAKDEIINIMRLRRKVKVNQKNDFGVFTQDTIAGLYNQLTGAAFLVMIIISSIGLIVGGIGVMNIMLVSVKERTREIGLRKAIGARRIEIRNQFLYEAIVLTLSGGMVGVVCGILVSLLIKALSGLPVAVNPLSIMAALAVSTSVGLFFGIYPASQAAKLNPVDALHYE
ncbi:MAG: ABC transporter permease [Acidobacteria bacterium]|nr:ABC transporter permease [Acidobacteriota bacterium]